MRITSPRGLALRLAIAVMALTTGFPRAAGRTTVFEHFQAFWDIPDARELAEHRLDTLQFRVQVLVMQLDVTNDGVPELFVGTTWGTSRRGVPWVAYMRQADGRYRPLGFLEFGPGDFMYLPSESLIFTIGSAGGGHADYRYYRVGAKGVTQVTDDRVYRSTREHEAAMGRWVETERPPVVVTELASLRTGQPQWRLEGSDKPAAQVPELGKEVTESGECSAEKFLDDHRGAGCRGDR